MSKSIAPNLGLLHIIGHRTLGVLIVYQYNRSGTDKLKILNISRKDIEDYAANNSLLADGVFAELGYALALAARTLNADYKITNNKTDIAKAKAVEAMAKSTFVSLLAGEKVSDADFNYVVAVENNSEGGFDMGRFSTDLGPVNSILTSFSSSLDDDAEADMKPGSFTATINDKRAPYPFPAP